MSGVKFEYQATSGKSVMSYSETNKIASTLRVAIYFSGHAPKIEKVKLGDKDVWRVSAKDVITVDVFSPHNIVVYTYGKCKTFNSEYPAKTYILSEILEK